MRMYEDLQQVWRISRRTATLLFLAPFIGLALIVAARFAGQDVWRHLDKEDGPIEWLQFAGLAVSSALCLAIGCRLAAQRRLLAAVLYSLLGLGLAFVAGEEIAWGQRLLGFETPVALAEVNEKREMSVHNVGSLSDLFN